MQTFIGLSELTPLVNFLRNDNSRCCCTKETQTERAYDERTNYGFRPAGRDTANFLHMTFTLYLLLAAPRLHCQEHHSLFLWMNCRYF